MPPEATYTKFARNAKMRMPSPTHATVGRMVGIALRNEINNCMTCFPYEVGTGMEIDFGRKYEKLPAHRQ